MKKRATGNAFRARQVLAERLRAMTMMTVDDDNVVVYLVDTLSSLRGLFLGSGADIMKIGGKPKES